MKNPTHCDIGTCHEPHTGSLVTCDDGIRRAMCAKHKLRLTAKQRLARDAEKQARRVELAEAYRATMARKVERDAAKVARVAARRAVPTGEVCACTYHGGRLVRVCRKHGGA